MGIGSRRGRVLRNITMCIMVVLIGLTSYKGNNISLAETIYSMNVRGEIVTSEDAIKLTWDAPNKSEPYTYKVYSKKPQTDSFQSISSTDLTQKVKVLNVTPEGGTPITYTTWDGTTRTVTKSASAEKWMEEPNTYHQKGFGMGLIDVEPLGMKYFNTNPEGYLKNSKGEYKYDVIFFGSWDTNNSQDLTKESQELVGEFIDTGRGVLFGHDTVDGIGNKNYNFAPLRKYVNIKLEYLDNIGYIPRTGSSKVMLEKEGLLNHYPWSIGKIGDVLDIPVAHSGGQLSFGDTWLTFKDNKLYGGSWGTASVLEVEDPELGKGTNNFYLSTWNNTAMIQTGHSNGEATIDEQKILANTLFYLSQLTTDTKLTDRSAMDATPPKFKSTEHTIKRVNGNVTIDFSSAEDVGTPFEYYVEATGQNTGKVLKSETIKVGNTSGLAGYATVIDNSPNTVPDNKVNTTTTTVTTPKEVGKPKYLHVVAVDKKGNKSEPQHIKLDNTPPTMEISSSTTDWTNMDITVNVKLTDEGSGLHQFKYLGTTTALDGSNSSSLGLRNFSKNGTYALTVVDKAGNETTKEITISNIDKEKPTIEFKTNPTGWTNKNIEITATGVDKLSGIKNVRMAEGATTNSKNVVAMNNITKYKLVDSLTEGFGITYESNGSDPYTGLALAKELVEPNKEYVLSYDVTKLSGNITGIGGHIDLSSQSEVYIDGKQVTKSGAINPYHEVVPYPNDSKKHHIMVKLNSNKYDSIANKNIYIQPNRRVTGQPFKVLVENIQLEKGTEETPFEPNYKDLLDNKNPLTVNVSENGTYSFITTDNAGNEGTDTIEITTIDKTPPKVVSTIEDEDKWSSISKNITITAKDDESGVASITKPDGSSVNSTTATYKVTENGKYDFKVQDKSGNEVLHTVNVTKIDKDKPELNIDYTPKGWTNKDITLNIEAKDTQSGLSHLELPDGSYQGVGNSIPVNVNLWEVGHYNEAVDKHGNYGDIALKGRLRTKPANFYHLNNATELSVSLSKDYYLSIYYYTEPNLGGYMAGTRKVAVVDRETLKLPEGAKYARVSVYKKDESVTPLTQDSLDKIGLTLVPNTSSQTYKTTYKVETNGTYTVKTVDNVGNEEVKSLTINSIDKTPPTLTVNGNPKDYTEEDSVTLELSAIDGQSGVKSIKLPDGKIELSNRASFTVNANGDYMFEITDNVGNVTKHTETVDKIKIPYTFYIYDSKGKPLKGAGFDLLRNGIKVADSESGEEGLVNFGKVPADGKYTIKQTKAPDGYVVNPDEKDVEVGDTTEPEEFISYPRGDLLPATGKYDRLIQGLIILGLTGVISAISVKKIKNKRI